jgi:TadE-like protein
MVEFALITPVFFLVFFSIVEFALITASIGSYDFAARDGARLGAIVGPTDPNIDTETTPNAGIVPTIQGHVQGVVMAKATEIDIYNADPASGLCISSVATAPPVQVDAAGCQEDEYTIGSNWTVTPTLSAWLPGNRNASAGSSGQYLGVRVLYQYTYVTGFVAGLGTPLSLSVTSVQRIEPLTTSVHHRSSPAAFGGTRGSPRGMPVAGRGPAGSPCAPGGQDVAASARWMREDKRGCL